MTRSSAGRWSRSSSPIGARSIAPSRAASSNAGVSSSLRRMIRPAMTTTALSQNGIRQPQDSSWSSGSAPIGRKAAVAMIRPACVPLSVKLEKNPRRSSGACSSVSEFPSLSSRVTDQAVV
jgi:hypothetical protein